MFRGKTTSEAFLRWVPAGQSCWPRVGRLLPLVGLLLITFLTAGVVYPGADTTIEEKSSLISQQTAYKQLGDVPSLDASLPSRVETFTFGLG